MIIIEGEGMKKGVYLALKTDYRRQWLWGDNSN